MVVFRVFIGILLVAWGYNGVAAHASASHAPASLHRQVADRLGAALAVAPRVTYPPDEVKCWTPTESGATWDFNCVASSQTMTKKGTIYRDTYYRVDVFYDGHLTYVRTLTSWQQVPWGIAT